ncbi:MAG: hypothetical protein CTY35_04865 [Methylotenera sp.]|jgi:hypothetical protein|uniref:hypothetical protein n=1 Tax=Methylotenera TaxID=359407 RepID=UPI000371AB6D|nr:MULTISPECIES: hypothetical protein [Methylotenera]MDP3777549.1 hypothetical protein [Methylotenera sp.]PPC97442.1 MAG: hypothetical protein CTY32_01575 [Methylotenera sp.]PPC98699.1 MAG: hypothetical protein CTY35_04865 [Methylotenera sp.]
MTGHESKDDLKSLAHILSALQKSASDHNSYQKTIGQVGSDFEHLLQQEIPAISNTESGLVARSKAALHIFLPLKDQTAVFERIQKVSGLSDRQIRLAIRSGILRIDQYERPALNDIHAKFIPNNKGIAYLFTLGLLSGVIISQIFYQPTGGLAHIFYGLGFGLATGSITGLVLDRSFRAYPLVEKLEKLAPWIATS